DITHQAEVDAMAAAIEDALAELGYKEADYTKVDAAIAKAEALNPNDYADFSKVEAAIAAVVRGKDITHQAEVDAMAAAIEDAIAGLERNPGLDITLPKTGDDSHIVLWISLMLAAGAALTGMLVCGRRKNYDR
ncbi:MAG: LPXTG cell wall anchor domain-containing protein, partial [Clostridia bacterium]|nr:LPXTG cell wall anchor domain-containing protein [Clostridia bacterium]